MITHIPRTTSYESEKNQARKLLRYKKLIVILPAVVLILLGAIISFATQVYALLVVSLLGVIYIPIILVVLNKQFEQLNSTIKSKYVAFYKPGPNGIASVLTKDNKSYLSAIGSNPLYTWRDDTGLNYISQKFFKINELSFKETSFQNYCAFLNLDIGKLIIPYDDIDHFRENILVCTNGDDITRFTFSNDDALDALIPQKEYYYSSEKKSGQPQ